MYRPLMKRKVLVASMLASLTLTLLTISGTVASASKAKHPTQSAPTVELLPVTSCTTAYGAGNPHPYVATKLPVAGPTHGLSVYSNGMITVLAPSGWSCDALVAADGGSRLDVYPPGHSGYGGDGAPKGAEAVQLDTEYTGHLPGAFFICGLFPDSAAGTEVRQNQMSCSGLPVGEHERFLTPDIIEFSDPAGVAGSGAGSGGSLASVGLAVYPQVTPATQSINVSKLSCTLPKRLAPLCAQIEEDYLIRDAPVYTGYNGG
jgi:hypothetical protein